jgi:RNA polymerase sigma factor for flagellar operon FliA
VSAITHPRPDAPGPGSRAEVDVDALVLANLPLVGHCVGEVMSRVPAHVDRDDLAGAGVEGLLQAARSWRPETGVPFSAHARTRIRGAVIDELRGSDWATRGTRSRARRAAETTEQLTSALGRTPTTDELADAMGVDADHVHRVRAETHRSYLTSLEEQQASPGGPRPVHEAVRDPGLSPEEHVVLAEHLGRLHRAVELLPDRVREAVRGHYLHEEPMAAIAARLGVTESRVSQLRAEGVAMLRAVLAAEAAERTAVGERAEPASPPPAGPRVPAQARRPTRREEAYYAAAAAAADTRTSLGVGTAVLSGGLSGGLSGLAPVRAAATG